MKHRCNDLWVATVEYDEDPQHRHTIPSEVVDIIAIKCVRRPVARKKPAPPTMGEMKASTTSKPITSFDEFLDGLRPTRRSIPSHLWGPWGAVVKEKLAQFRAHPSETTLLEFLMLPSRYVPALRIKTLEKTLQRQEQAGVSHPSKIRLRTEDEKAITRAMALAEQGLLARASKALQASKPANLEDPKIWAKVLSKYPSAHKEMKHDIPTQQIAPFLADDVRNVVRKQSNGASGGMTGWTKELMWAAMSAIPTIADDLGMMAAIILSEFFTNQWIRDCLQCLKFVGLVKEEDDVRPIAVGDAMQKLISGLCFEKDGPTVASWQLGLGTPFAAAKIRDAVTRAIGRGKSILAVDAHNAFNSVAREAQERRIRKCPYPHLRQYFRWMYYTATKLVARTSKGVQIIKNVEGNNQGDLCSSWFFCDAIEEPVNSVQVEEKYGYFDDLTMIDSTDKLLAELSPLDGRLQDIGISLNMKKTELYSPTPLTEEQRTKAEAIGLKIIEPHQAFKLLGGPVGTSIDAQREIIQRNVDKAKTYFQRVATPMIDSRLAYTLLRACGVPKFNYLCQTTEPEVMRPAYAQFDEMTREAFTKITGIPGSNTLIHAPEGAALTSFIVKGPELYQRTQDAIRGVIRNKATEEVDDGLPKSDCQLNPLLQSHSRSAVGNHAATFLLYAEPASHMSPEDFCYAMQLRCGFAKPKYKICECGSSLPGGFESLAHLLVCKNNYYGYNSRHEEIKNELIKILKAWGFNVQPEPKQFHSAEHDTRPDFCVYLSRVSPVVDVTVVTNIADSYVKDDSPADRAAEEKVKKHEANVVSKGAFEFYPIAIESSGNAHHGFDDFITVLESELPFGSRRKFRRAMCFALSVALQRGNARILKGAYTRIDDRATFGAARWS